jgi:hypothetical protein
MDGIAGGAPIADINNMSPEVWLSFSATSIKNMPAETVNALPSNIINLTTSTQLGAFYTSPYYSSYSNSFKSTLNLISAQTPTDQIKSGSEKIKLNLTILGLTSLISLFVGCW